MRILLIGGNGLIGRHVLVALREQGHTLGLFHRGTSARIPGVEEIHGDRNRLKDSLQQLERFAPHVVIDFVISSGSQAEELMGGRPTQARPA
jgi:nucleoside-diphosphate-sugar epimerase